MDSAVGEEVLSWDDLFVARTCTQVSGIDSIGER